MFTYSIFSIDCRKYVTYILIKGNKVQFSHSKIDCLRENTVYLRNVSFWPRKYVIGQTETAFSSQCSLVRTVFKGSVREK